MQGTDHLFLSYISVFNIGNYRQHVVLKGELPQAARMAYAKEVESDPAALIILTTEKALLSKIIADKHCKVTILKGLE